jgi:RNA polymerase sigma-70 factor, ECF subfamily
LARAPSNGIDVDPATLAAARRGEHKAFIAILRHYDRRLRLLAYRLLADRQLMDDALRDVAVKAFKALPQFRGQAGAWLYQITYTTCLDCLRRTHPVELMPVDELPEPWPAADTADLVSEWDLLERRLSLLSPEQRLAVLLVDQEGFDYRTAAAIMGIPPGTIGSRLCAAHAILRRGLTPPSCRRPAGLAASFHPGEPRPQLATPAP